MPLAAEVVAFEDNSADTILAAAVAVDTSWLDSEDAVMRLSSAFVADSSMLAVLAIERDSPSDCERTQGSFAPYPGSLLKKKKNCSF